MYQVIVDDPDKQHLSSDEVSLVHNPAELAHWVKLGKVAKPESYEMIPQADTVILAPGQKIDLLFKFITHRAVISDQTLDSSPHSVK